MKATLRTFKLPGWIWWVRVDPAGVMIHAWPVEGLAGDTTESDVHEWITKTMSEKQ